MPEEVVVIGLIALAGLLIGGAYAMWRTAKLMAGLLAVLALLAGGGALAWYLSG